MTEQLEMLPGGPLSTSTDRAHKLDGVANQVRMRLKNMSAHIIEIGRELIAVKRRLGHDRFLEWVSAACDLAPRQAQLMMRAAKWAEGREEIVSHLEPTLLYLLAARSTPKTVRQEVMSRLEEGRRPALQAVKDLIRAAREMMPNEPASNGKRGILVPPQSPRSEDLLAYLFAPADLGSEGITNVL